MATGTLEGKSDILLQREMDAVFDDLRIKAHSSFERKRGRVTISVDYPQSEQATFAFLRRHPDFVFRLVNPCQKFDDRIIHYLIFMQRR